MEQPLAPATPDFLRGLKPSAWGGGILLLVILVGANSGYFLLWVILVPLIGKVYLSLNRRWFYGTSEGQTYATAMAQYRQDYAVWHAGMYRQQLQIEAMNDWVRMTGGQYEPTVEWVVNRMHGIEQERATAAHRQQQAQMQGLQLLGIAALLGEQRRTARAVNNLNNRLR